MGKKNNKSKRQFFVQETEAKINDTQSPRGNESKKELADESKQKALSNNEESYTECTAVESSDDVTANHDTIIAEKKYAPISTLSRVEQIQALAEKEADNSFFDNMTEDRLKYKDKKMAKFAKQQKA